MNSELVQNSMQSDAPLLGHVEAYCVFDGIQLRRVLSKAEFEAITDGDLSLKGCSGKVPLVFITANQHQLIQAAVMFYLHLDESGYVLDGWRLPLQRLSDTAGRGPNLGGGRIRLACRSQCSISWHKDALWDPATSTFMAIKRAIHSEFDALVRHEANAKDIQSEELDASDGDDVDTLKRTLRNETASYRNQLQSLQQEIERQRLLNERLHRKIETEHPSVDDETRLDLTALRQQNEQHQQRIRELEVINERLHSEAQNSGEQSQDDVEPSALIEQMNKADMLSVVYHPGAGHINLSPNQLLDYLEDPIAYAAHQVSLSKEQYLLWIDHHEKAKCQVCDAQITVIGNPRIFDPEVDIYCESHRPT